MKYLYKISDNSRVVKPEKKAEHILEFFFFGKEPFQKTSFSFVSNPIIDVLILMTFLDLISPNILEIP